MIRDVGDGFSIEYQARDPDGALTNATVALTLTVPAGSSTPTSPSPTNPSTGIYRYTIPLDVAGEFEWDWTVTGTVQDKAHGSVLAVAVAPPAYATVEQLKLWLAGRAAGSTITLAMDSERDQLLQGALEAASRGIDAATGRRFWRDTTASARRYAVRGRTFWTDEGEVLLVDDFATETGLVVEVGSAGATDFSTVTGYETGPDNALADMGPLNRLLRIGTCWSTFRTARVRVTAAWGWPAIPSKVEQATLIWASRLYKRKDSPEGVLGNAEWGTVRLSREDPDVKALIEPYILPGFG